MSGVRMRLSPEQSQALGDRVYPPQTRGGPAAGAGWCPGPNSSDKLSRGGVLRDRVPSPPEVGGI